ncbi:hypothetical protein GGI43DRAFT_136361 [Trichoderma evansii]
MYKNQQMERVVFSCFFFYMLMAFRFRAQSSSCALLAVSGLCTVIDDEREGIWLEPACHDMAYFSETNEVRTRRVPHARRKKKKQLFFRPTSCLALLEYHTMAFLLFLSTYITALQSWLERIERVTSARLVTSHQQGRTKNKPRAGKELRHAKKRKLQILQGGFLVDLVYEFE